MKVLIVRVGALGDVLHALPAVAALRHERPDWQIDWVVDRRWAPLLVNEAGAGPLVNHVHLAETRLWTRSPLSSATLRSILALRQQLRAAGYDQVADLQGTLRSAVIGRMAGPQLAGFADPRESLAAKLYSLRVPRVGVHVVEQGTALLSAATQTPLTPGAALLPLEPQAELWAASMAGERPLCVLAPGAGWGAKRWPAARFGELARLLDQLGYSVVVNAPGDGDPLAGEVTAASAGKATAVACSVAGMVAMVRRAALLVGGDSGPVHLAAALGTPVVALFGPTDPARNGPWGAGPKVVLRDAASVTSYKRSEATDPGLAMISAGDVVAAVRKLTGQ